MGRALTVGYYVHHHGRGHLHRAGALAAELGADTVTALSSLGRPDDWTGDWLDLPLDTGPDEDPVDPSAGGTLHWAPLGHDGLRRRTALISAWLDRTRPDLVVSDVSQEVALLCRLHGVPVLSVVLPGHRHDAAHLAGLRSSSVVVGFWPTGADDLLPGLPADLAERVVPLGGLSRFTPDDQTLQRRPGPRRLVVLGGQGGDAWTGAQVATLREAAHGWEVTVLGAGGDWVEDPWPVLRDADVAVVHGGQNAVAEIAAARVPAVVVPAERPFDEQRTTATGLDAGPWPAVALDRLEHPDWPALLERVAGLDGARWSDWVDGGAAARFAALVTSRQEFTPGDGRVGTTSRPVTLESAEAHPPGVSP